MPETLSIQLPDFAAVATLNLYLRRPDTGALVNTAGDALTDIDSNGRFTATLTEARTGLGTLAAAVYDGVESADNLVWDGWLLESKTLITDTYGPAELDTETLRVKLDADQPDYAPALEPQLRGDLTLAEAVDLILAGVLGVSSQPAETTELFKFVDAANAFTTTFDTSGNRTAVEIH